MKRRLLLGILLIFPAVLFAAPTQRYIVLTRHPFDSAVRALPTDDFSPGPRAAMHIRRFKAIDAFAATLTADQIQRLNDSSEVQLIEPAVERHAMDDAIIPGEQITTYGVRMVNAPQVWPVTQGKAVDGSGPIHVAIIDTGIDYNSPELKAVYKGGTNLVDGTNDPLDNNGHGTHVAGIIAAADDNEGVVGVAPGVDLYAVKVLDACGSGSSENIIAAVDCIIQKKTEIGGHWVANLSLGSDTPDQLEQAEFQKGSDDGILFFAAAGNGYDPTNPTTNLAYPGGYPTVVSVGAVDSTEMIADFSQRGPDLKVVAPGVSVLSTFLAAEVATSDGRQYAGTTPVVVDAQGNPTNGFCLPAPRVPAAPYVFCSYGASASDFPSIVEGKIALIKRGPPPPQTGITFVNKILNAQKAGAIGVILFDHTPNEPLVVPELGGYSNASLVPNFPPTVFISNEDGTALENASGLTTSLSFGFETWALEEGTSMSTPHATGVAALVWAVAPNASATDVANAIEANATNLGDANTYGHGLVNALTAAVSLNPSAFGITTTVPKTIRVPGQRGH